MPEEDRAGFLSCLLGSERDYGTATAGDHFLSCLLGSEPCLPAPAGAIRFLSCLLGSERSA